MDVPLTWCEQENLVNKAHLRPYPEHCGFCVSSRCKLHHKDTARRSYRTVHAFVKPVTRRFNPYPTAFPYGNGMVLHFYQQQESSTTKTVHKVINKGLKTYV